MNLMDSILQPIAQKQELYIKDKTTHFISFIENTPALPEAAILATLHMCGLCTLTTPRERE